ncbi:C40 family peptidase [Nocardioides silvaticus]|uniref:C40 family peptidase n=1 Tax=Nocardioides silvaticus TaxID=2201891 RepID=UPI0011B1ED1D|nr:C40 family peptidase [Nocardioides silvaticus]
MHTRTVRAVARRTALAATAAALATTTLVDGTPSTATPVLAAFHGEAPQLSDTFAAHPKRVERTAELRERRKARERAERRKERREEQQAAEEAATRGERVVALASQEAGDPYVYGAAGPSSFDCSGFTQYVYAQVGVSLPHSSSAQAGVAQEVSDPQVGDLVFFTGSGGVYHVAIYAGDGMLWHSPNSGSVVSLEPIWTSSVFYGRVL